MPGGLNSLEFTGRFTIWHVAKLLAVRQILALREDRARRQWQGTRTARGGGVNGRLGWTTFASQEKSSLMSLPPLTNWSG